MKNINLKLEEAKMIPVFYHSDINVCEKVVQACYDGGVRAFEFTNRGDNALAVFKELKLYSEANFPDLLLGAGSILNLFHVDEFVAAGADFIVSPFLNESILTLCKEKNVYAIPGCMTLTEIVQAQEWGADIVKLFPGSVLGPDFVSAVRGPMPQLKLMPTGGVEPTERSLRAWFNSGVVCVGMGSQLLSKDIIEKENYSALTEQVRVALSIINSMKK